MMDSERNENCSVNWFTPWLIGWWLYHDEYEDSVLYIYFFYTEKQDYDSILVSLGIRQ